MFVDKAVVGIASPHRLFITLVMLGFMLIYFQNVATYFNAPLLDAELTGYDANLVNTRLKTFGEHQRHLYLTRVFPPDMVFAASYTLFFAAATLYFYQGDVKLSQHSPLVKFLTLSAYLGGLCDMIENSLFYLFISQYPTRFDYLVPIASTITVFKYLFFAVNTLSALFGFLLKMWGFIFTKEDIKKRK